ncbi:imidazole glycerol phosphate synthase subunit HisH [Sedimentibacter saalensis]|uniref:Imidazole glycerol phosphate synthase subunit HisH n=1 Tax=Sedimentibacter saalensis TaxID=130788 RepID=A0A562JM22_9FIRM|nr:imidazole glycerol phosphate synthase subunit HisH [Sedimentibacter saalensis]MEA5096077.1 imidazole glycerol phosphate synthase subunit HisH [Sedimentibacter saalensis]TWH83974.1 glutamine amidotransferase [Sedimentibacter saalensis]
MHVIIDYGMGNLASVERAFEKLGVDVKISSKTEDLRNAKSLILPGVGAFRDAIKLLDESGLSAVIKEEVAKGKYLIGICLGMQLLYEKGYEYGEYDGLGLIKGDIEYLDVNLKVPHMGWNNLKFNKQDPILKYIKEDEYVYFVHSYYAVSDNQELVAYSDYEKMVPAIVRKNNVYGIQFHPEKSGETGQNILKAYKEIIEK